MLDTINNKYYSKQQQNFLYKMNGYMLSFIVLMVGLLPPQIAGIVVYKFQYITFFTLDILVLLSIIFMIGVELYIGKVNKMQILWFFMVVTTLCVVLLNAGVYNNELIASSLLIWGKFMILFFVATVSLPNKVNKQVLSVLLIVLSLNLLLGILTGLFSAQMSSLIRSSGHVSQNAFSIIGGQISLSYIAAMFIALLSFHKSVSQKNINIIAVILLLIILLVFDTRTGFVMFGITLIGSFFYGMSFIKKILYFILMMVVIGGIFLTLGNSHRITQVQLNDNSSLLRLNVLLYSMSKIEETPLLGQSPGKIFPYKDKHDVYDTVSESGNYVLVRDGVQIPTEPHDSYLLIGVDYGLVVVILFIIFLLIMYYKIGRVDRFNRYKYFYLSMIFIGATTSSFMVNDIKLTILFYVSIVVINIKKQKRLVKC